MEILLSCYITNGSSTLFNKCTALCANNSQSWVTLCQSLEKKGLELLHAKARIRLIECYVVIFPTANAIINAVLSFRLSIFPNSPHTAVPYDWSSCSLFTVCGLKAVTELIYKETFNKL